MSDEITSTSDLFTPTDIECPKKCGTLLNRLNAMLICEKCGWYLIKLQDRKGFVIKSEGEIRFDKPHVKPLGKQYAKKKLKLLIETNHPTDIPTKIQGGWINEK